MRTSSCKQKGRKLQQFIISEIYRIFPELDKGDVENRSMGAGGIDVILSPKARKIVPLSIEAKNTKTHPGLAELRQSQFNAYPDTVSVVAWHPPRAQYSDTLIIMRLEDLLKIFKDGRQIEDK
jgi:hypothetical protein